MVPFGIRTDQQSLKVVENLKKGHSLLENLKSFAWSVDNSINVIQCHCH